MPKCINALCWLSMRVFFDGIPISHFSLTVFMFGHAIKFYSSDHDAGPLESDFSPATSCLANWRWANCCWANCCWANRCWAMLQWMIAGTLFLGAVTGTIYAQDAAAGKKIVVCSTTQIADFARNIVGDQWEVKCILAAGQDPHSYRTTAADSGDVATADLCLENGWNLEGHGWMRKLAQGAQRPIRTCIQGVTPLQTDDPSGEVKDPHAWMDPANAWIYVKNIRDAVSEIDPANAELFEARAQLYSLQLRSLKVWISSQVDKIPQQQRILVSHHDAFGYFCQAFNFEARSPQGWSTAELKGVSPTKQKEIVDMIRQEGVKSIFVETTLKKEMIEAIAKDAGVEIGGELYSDAMGPEGSAGETYLGMMRENVLTIVGALK